MNQLKVILWGEELGRLVWDQRTRNTYFTFNPSIKERPDVSPILAPRGFFNDNVPLYGDDRKIYQKLPPFIADSLPDAWGNRLFDRWVKDNRIPRNQVTPLYKLMFIGTRGMGALEFEPAANDLNYEGRVNIKDLYNLALEVLEERSEKTFSGKDNPTMESLIAVGTSAGGRQMKALISINKATGEIRSGQVANPPGFEAFILKFEDPFVPTSEIEMAYHDMAVEAGIKMEECFLLEVEGESHFATRRFDRRENQKIHMQTLAAIDPEAGSYEDMFSVARKLNLSEKEIEELYRRTVFNIIANNTDDHNKNFSFILERNGGWVLAPAYDLTFIFNRNLTAGETERVFSLYGKDSDITKGDLIGLARENNIRNPEAIIRKVISSVLKFPEYSSKYGLPDKIFNLIHTCLHKNLEIGEFIETDEYPKEFPGINGNKITLESLKLNSKGIYEIKAKINGELKRKFIPPKDPNFENIQKFESHSMTESESRALFEKLFDHFTFPTANTFGVSG